jgi:hypothetical protein
MENVQLWTALLGNLGFPVVLAGYLLIRFEKKIESLTEAISALKDTCGDLLFDKEKRQ